MSSHAFPQESYARTLMTSSLIKSKYTENQTISYDDLKGKLVAVDIYFDKLEYTKITELENMRGITLVSNIGGIFSSINLN